MFAQLNQPAGDTPFSLAGVVAPLDKGEFAVFDYDDAYAYDGLLGVKPLQVEHCLGLKRFCLKTSLGKPCGKHREKKERGYS